MRRALVAVVCLALGACGGSGGDDATAISTPLDTPADATVKMVTDKRTVGAFDPKTITVAVGEVVEFPNESDAAHDVAFDAKVVKDSSVYGPDKNFKASFPTAGTYQYECTLHPGMKGVVKVA